MSGVKVELDVKPWREALVKRLAGNMEIACKFVETEARANLLAIQEPEWGAGYREKVVGRLLTHKVNVSEDLVEGVVGVERGAQGEDHGYWIETGSKTAPPQPWLRPAVFHNAREIVKLLEGK